METLYKKLREHLDNMPNGFPASESGVEIEILKRIFTEAEASLFMQLKMKYETPQQISARTGAPVDYLEKILPLMKRKGQLMGINVKNLSLYKAIPYIVGIYEFQLSRMDKELAELFDRYDREAFGKDFFSKTPAVLKAVPIGIEVKDDTKIEPYEDIIALIEGAKSWSVRDCICKTEKSLLGKKCDKPREVCLYFSPAENAFKDDPANRVITKEEAYSILKLSEEAGLVHMTSNYRSEIFFICNCCSCCCGVLRKYIAVSKNAAAKSNYIAVVDNDECIACGACVERCQADAIIVDEFAVIRDCIGCGLCVSSCSAGAIKLVPRSGSEVTSVPANEREWMEIRAQERGMSDIYKKML